jgi:methionine salvage enolase-phosphatase E1
MNSPLGYLVSFVLGCVVMYVIKPLLGSYSAKKGENLATKEDIAELTKIAEGIRAKISDDVWDRQRQWELRRDVVLDSVRALADLDGAVGEFYVACSRPTGNLTKEAEDALKGRRVEAMKLFTRCSSSYQRAHTVADVAIGGKLSKNISGYFQCALPFVGKVQSDRSSVDKNAQKQLTKWHNAVILSAREALGIKEAGDLPVLDYDNELTTDN